MSFFLTAWNKVIESIYIISTLFHAVQLYFTRLKKKLIRFSTLREVLHYFTLFKLRVLMECWILLSLNLETSKASCWILQSLRHCILNDFKTNRWLFIIRGETVSHGKYLTPHEINLCIHCEYWAFISLGWVILVSKLLFFSTKITQPREIKCPSTHSE